MATTWSDSDMTALVQVIREVVQDELKKQGVPCFVPAIVQQANNDGTFDVYLPPDNTNIVTGKINRSGEELRVGDSVELLCKKGTLSDSWIAIKHKSVGTAYSAIDLVARQAANEANARIDDLSVGGAPYINSAGNWEVWDSNLNRYVDTGISAEPAKSVVHTQSTAATEWTITHNLNKYPSVTIVDDSMKVMLAEIQYIDMNTVKLSFISAQTGKAILN